MLLASQSVVDSKRATSIVCQSLYSLILLPLGKGDILESERFKRNFRLLLYMVHVSILIRWLLLSSDQFKMLTKKVGITFKFKNMKYMFTDAQRCFPFIT